MRSLTAWWLDNKPMPPFDITVVLNDGNPLQITIAGVKIYEQNIWFLDAFNNEYFKGDNVLISNMTVRN